MPNGGPPVRVGAMVKANPSWVARVWTNVAIDDYIQAHVAGHDWNLIKQKQLQNEVNPIYRIHFMAPAALCCYLASGGSAHRTGRAC